MVRPAWGYALNTWESSVGQGLMKPVEGIHTMNQKGRG